MTHRYIKMGATVTVLTLAFAALLWSTLREGTEYFNNIDEVVSAQVSWEGKQLQPARLRRTGVDPPQARLARLQIQSTAQSDPRRTGRRHRGSVLLRYRAGHVQGRAEVVLKGRLGPDGFHTDPDGVMAKCPSKYEAASKSASAGS